MITRIVCLFTSCFLLAACEKTALLIPRTEVSAVYWHERNRFSVAVQVDTEIKFVRIDGRKGLRIITDVKQGESLWYECSIDYGYDDFPDSGGCDIHIESIESLQTAGWNHGKFGSGATIRLAITN